MVIKHYLWLFSLGLFALWQIQQIPQWDASWRELLNYSPFVLGGLGIFFSIWLNRIQPLLILLNIMLLNAVLGNPQSSTDINLSLEILFPVLTILFPLNLLLWLSLPEKGVHNRPYVFFVVTVLLLQMLGLAWLLRDLPIAWIAPLTLPVSPGADAFIRLPFWGALTFLVVGFLLSLKLRDRYRLKVLDHAVLVVLLLMVFGLNNYHQTGLLAWLSSIAELMVLFALIFDAHHMAYTDELTGLKGRRALTESFMGLGKQYSIAMVDIDYFKKFNDSYGHDVGDEVLRRVADVLATVQGGRAYRFGGEEFALVFKGQTAEEAYQELEYLRAEIAREPMVFEHKGKQTSAQVTVSIGVADKDKTLSDANAVLKRADQGLYQAKEGGRNQTVVMSEGTEMKRRTQDKPTQKSAVKSASKPPVKRTRRIKPVTEGNR